jgi:hypothetical protein
MFLLYYNLLVCLFKLLIVVIFGLFILFNPNIAGILLELIFNESVRLLFILFDTFDILDAPLLLFILFILLILE